MKSWFAAAAVLGMAGVVAACSSTGGDDGDGGSGGKDPTGTGTNTTTGTMMTTSSTMATTSSSGNGGNGGAGGGATCENGVPGFQPACQNCLDANCCAEQQACGAEPQCTDLLECEVGCPQGDTACIDACIAAAPLGAPLLDDFDDCFGGPICGLADACNVPQAAICDSGFAFGSAQMPATAKQRVCAQCLGEPGCCEDFTACFADANCNTCLTTAPPGNQVACDATMLDEAANVCFGTTCMTECAP